MMYKALNDLAPQYISRQFLRHSKLTPDIYVLLIMNFSECHILELAILKNHLQLKALKKGNDYL